MIVVNIVMTNLLPINTDHIAIVCRAGIKWLSDLNEGAGLAFPYEYMSGDPLITLHKTKDGYKSSINM